MFNKPEEDPLPINLRIEVDKRLKAEKESAQNTSNRVSLPAIQINNGQQPWSTPDSPEHS